MKAVEKELGLELNGLAFRAKTASSVDSKIRRKYASKIGESNPSKINPKDIPLEKQIEILSEIGDMARYTFIAKHDELGKACKDIVKSLESRGYKLSKVDNKYADGAVYKGIHLDFIAPNGMKIEMQVHSKQSKRIKDENEKIYQQYREHPPTSKAYEDGVKACVKNSNSIKTPKDIKKLETLTLMAKTNAHKITKLQEGYKKQIRKIIS